MKKRTIAFSTAAILIVLIAVPFVYAQRMRGKRAGRGGDFGAVMMLGHLEQAREKLGLSDQQVSDIKAIFQDLHAQNAPFRQQLHSGFGSIAQTLVADPKNVDAAQTLLANQESAEHAMKVNALNAAARALNVLTPDQRTKLAEHLKARFADR